jgi:putative ABC transport system permease protein
VEQASLIPVNAPFSPENKPSFAFRLTISAIANDSSLGRFSLKSNQVAPFTVFLNRDILAEKLELAGLANTILLGENQFEDLSPEKITMVLNDTWKPLDAGLSVKELPGNGKYELVSNRIFIDKPLSNEIEKLQLPHETILTYLVNSFRTKSKSTPYSFLTAASPAMLPGEIMPGDIVINEWLARDLEIKPGDSLSLDYFVIGPLRKLTGNSRNFKVSTIIPTSGSFTDSTLMPRFPGLSDAGNCRDWNTGVPIDLKRIRDKDEQYWDSFRGTPKGLIALSTGVNMWSNPFGEYTSVRFTKASIHPDSLLSTLMHKVHPEDLGMMVLPVYSEGLFSAGNAVDFGQLFMGLSFFIIAAGIILIVLIFSLNTSSRSVETALLSGLGLPHRLILRIRVAESAVVIILGSVFGAAAGILYNLLLVKALNTVWQGALQTNMLEIHIRFISLISGACIGFLLAFVTILLITRLKLKEQVAGLLKVSRQFSQVKQKNFSPGNLYISFVGLLLAALLISYSVQSEAYENPALFLAAGAFFLFGSIFGIAWMLEKLHHTRDYSGLSIFLLALKNAGRSKGRSLTVVTLLAIGVFSIIITGAYRKTFSGTETEKRSGTGGYLFWTDTSLPFPFDLNDPAVQKKYLLTDTLVSSQIHFEQFLSLDGDDASCLNLNQVRRPRILGVHSETFDMRDAFSFIALPNDSAKDHPWLLLKENMGKDVIPGVADQSVIQYGLKKSLGDTLYYLNERGEKLKIILVGGLENSVFQGNLLIDYEQFLLHFPSAGSSRVMLIDVPTGRKEKFESIMNRSFADYGIELSATSVRLADFNTVENTYLSVFMILGGLGLIIGTLGLAIVLFRNITERRHEFALLSALGLKDNQLLRLIMTENIFLLLSGLGCGSLAAFLAILPSWLSPGFHTQTLLILIILLMVVLSGFIWIWIPARNAISGNRADALRNE